MTLAIFLGSLLAAMVIGMPVAFALLASGVALMWHLDMLDFQILAQNLIGGADSFPLLAVPFFMLAGEVMNAGGLSRRIVDLALALVGHIRGGLGYVTIMAGCLLSALSGSAVADAAALTALLLPLIILVGLRMGVFTPTEAAVVAAVYALFVSIFIYGELKLPGLYRVFVSAAKTSAVVMFLIAAAMVSAWLITVANLPGQVTVLLQPFIDSPILLMAAIMVLVMLVGTAIDMTPTILILTPVLMPVVKAAGIDPVYFGVMFIINNSIGLVTPPVGTVLNVVSGVGRMRLDDVTRGVIPFMAAQFAMMFCMVLFPQLVTMPAKWLAG